MAIDNIEYNNTNNSTQTEYYYSGAHTYDGGSGGLDGYTSGGLWLGYDMSYPSSSDNKPRNLCKINGKTLNDYNLPIVVSDYTKWLDTYTYASGQSLAFTPYVESVAPWTLKCDIPQLYTEKGIKFSERDYWSDPRFVRSCCYECLAIDDISGSNIANYVYRDDANHLHIITTIYDKVTATVDIGTEAKRILVLLCGGGGGGGGGVHCWDTCYAGAGGGAGGALMLAVDVGVLESSGHAALKVGDSSDALYAVKEWLMITVGNGGAGGKAYDSISSYANDIPVSVMGSSGTRTTMVMYHKDSKLLDVVCYAGAGAGRAVTADNLSYNTPSGGGVGGEYYISQGLNQYCWVIPAYGEPGSFAVYGGKGGESDSSDTHIATQYKADDGQSESDNAIVACLCDMRPAHRTKCDAYTITKRVGGSKTSPLMKNGTIDGFDGDVLKAGGGGASRLSDGGSWLYYTYDVGNNKLSSNASKPNNGAGGCGGTSYAVRRSYGVDYCKATDGQAGADGIGLIWFPAPHGE